MTTMTVHRLLPFAIVLVACGGRRGAGPGVSTPGPAPGNRHAAAEAALDAATAEAEPGLRGAALAARIRTSPEAAGGDWAPRALYDPSPWVRRQAALALADRLPEPASLSALQELVARPDLDAYTRCGAGMHLARAGDQSTLPAVTAALDAASEGWEAAPCALTAAAMGSAGAVPRLEQALREGELPLELGFVRDLSGSGLAEVAPAVGEAVGLVEEPLRIPLAAAWMELGGTGGAAALRAALNAGMPEDQLTAVDFLVRSEASPAEELLKKAAGSDGPARGYARLALAARVGDLGPAQAAAVDVEDRDARLLAMELTGELVSRLDDPGGRVGRKARALLVGGLSDPDDAVRLAAARALARVGTPAEADALEPLLMAEGVALRVAAAEALLRLRPVARPGS
jgi:HEAT repeat protein